MTAPAKGLVALLRLALAWGVGCAALIAGLWSRYSPATLLLLMILSYATVLIALGFSLYGMAVTPRPFAWKSLLLFDGLMLSLALLGGIVFKVTVDGLVVSPLPVDLLERMISVKC